MSSNDYDDDDDGDGVAEIVYRLTCIPNGAEDDASFAVAADRPMAMLTAVPVAAAYYCASPGGGGDGGNSDDVDSAAAVELRMFPCWKRTNNSNRCSYTDRNYWKRSSEQR